MCKGIIVNLFIFHFYSYCYHIEMETINHSNLRFLSSSKTLEIESPNSFHSTRNRNVNKISFLIPYSTYQTP